MKIKKLIATFLLVMMVAALLPIGTLADESHMGKVRTLDEGFYVSVNGQAFTKPNQIIKCGSGTAKLTMGNYGDQPTLTLTNVTISRAENIGADGGASCYAGIVYLSNVDRRLIINIVGDCIMTAPAASTSSKVYEGIISNSYVELVGGKLKMNNYAIGIDSNGAYIRNCKMTAVSKIGIGCTENVLLYTSSISVTGRAAILADNVEIGYGTVSVTLNADNTAENKFAIKCSSLSIEKNCALNVSAYVNTKSFSGSGDYHVGAVYAHTLTGNKLNSQVNITDSGKAFVSGIYAESMGCADVTGNINITGKTNRSIGIKCGENFQVPSSERAYAISSTINGASEYDIPLVFGDRFQNGNKDTYISAVTDAENPVYGSIIFGHMPCDLNSEGADDKLALEINGRILCPDKGNYSLIEEDGDSICIVVDKDGNPAKAVVITNADHPFKDVKSADYFSDPVVWAYEKNITNGTSAITFGPNETCTRAQVVTFLWRAVGCPAVENAQNPFKDVKDGQWYTDAVLWAVENGITNGTSATTFSPNDKVTRAQTVTFLYRAANGTPVDASNPFKDVKAGQWYTDAVLWAVANGITNGTTPSTFEPNTVCTRGQIVTFLYRFINE